MEPNGVHDRARVLLEGTWRDSFRTASGVAGAALAALLAAGVIGKNLPDDARAIVTLLLGCGLLGAFAFLFQEASRLSRLIRIADEMFREDDIRRKRFEAEESVRLQEQAEREQMAEEILRLDAERRVYRTVIASLSLEAFGLRRPAGED